MAQATVLALAAAVLHAAWNLFLKRGVGAAHDRFTLAWGQFACGGAYGLALLVGLAATGHTAGVAAALPFAAVSGAVHIGYVRLLAAAYDHGDLSLAYPLARGGGALGAGLLGALLLGDGLSVAGWCGVAVVLGGLVSLLGRPPSSRALLTAAGVAATIGVYTVADAAGARRVDVALAYVALTSVATAVGVTGFGVATRRTAGVVAAFRAHTPRLGAAGAAALVTYGLVLVAVRHAPVGYVAALRESSVVVAALAGWRILGEPFGRARVASALTVAVGLVLLVAVTS